jgi:hypothetical protein
VRLRRAGLVLLGKTNTPELRDAPDLRADAVRCDPQPLGHKPDDRWLQWRLCGCGRFRYGADGLRQRRGRVDSLPCLLLRAVRAQADACTAAVGPRVRRRVQWAGRRARADPIGAGQLSPTRRDRWPQSRRPLLGTAPRTTIRRRGRCRSGLFARRLYRADAHRSDRPSRLRRGGARYCYSLCGPRPRGGRARPVRAAEWVGAALDVVYGAAIAWIPGYWIRKLGREPGSDEIEPFTRAAWEQGRYISVVDYLLAI